MPQMSPMNWAILFIFFSIMFLFSMSWVNLLND